MGLHQVNKYMHMGGSEEEKETGRHREEVPIHGSPGASYPASLPHPKEVRGKP